MPLATRSQGQSAPSGSVNQSDVANNNYQIRIRSTKSKTPIISSIPEQFSLSVDSTWNVPMNKSLTDSLPDGSPVKVLGKAGSTIFGQTTLSKYQTLSVWDQGSAMTVSLPMVFKAFNDPIKDVVNKIVSLMSMVCPYTDNGFLHAPGPTISSMMGNSGASTLSGVLAKVGINVDPASLGGESGEIITLEIGNFIKMTPVIVKTVDVEFDTKFDTQGNPMSATANITIETPYIVTRADLAQFFLRSDSAFKDYSDLFSFGTSALNYLTK